MYAILLKFFVVMIPCESNITDKAAFTSSLKQQHDILLVQHSIFQIWAFPSTFWQSPSVKGFPEENYNSNPRIND